MKICSRVVKLARVENESISPSSCLWQARQQLMRSFRLRESINRLGKRLTALLLLVVIVVAHFAIPFSSAEPKNGKDRSAPFPCQDRPCGCRTAEQCRKKCCCFSTEQKLAWAKRNGVKACEVVDASAKCEVVHSTPRKACCSSHCATKSKSTTPLKSRTKSVPRKKTVIGIVAQECQGNAQTLFGQPVFLIPAIISLQSLIEPTGERFICSGSRFIQPAPEPPVPPPRLVSA